NCALTSSQLPDLQYHLVRVVGRVLGLDWSQANLNVITRNPPPIAADYAGFPVLHEIDPVSCVPVAVCSNHGTVNPAQPKMDDQAGLSRPEAGISQFAEPPYFSASSPATVQSDTNGVAASPISTLGYSADIIVAGTASAGSSTLQFEAQQLGPVS